MAAKVCLKYLLPAANYSYEIACALREALKVTATRVPNHLSRVTVAKTLIHFVGY
jgi:hypothetical protein